MSECEKKMDEHWNFLKEFITLIVYESPNIEMTEKQVDAFGQELDNIQYGFKMAWKHAWKHGKEEKDSDT